MWAKHYRFRRALFTFREHRAHSMWSTTGPNVELKSSESLGVSNRGHLSLLPMISGVSVATQCSADQQRLVLGYSPSNSQMSRIPFDIPAETKNGLVYPLSYIHPQCPAGNMHSSASPLNRSQLLIRLTQFFNPLITPLSLLSARDCRANHARFVHEGARLA